MVKYIFMLEFVNSNKLLFILYSIIITLMIISTVWLVNKELRNKKDVNK